MGDVQHSCSGTAFEPFPDAALEGSIVDRFAAQVDRHRDCVAVVDCGRALSYGELDAWTNGVARAILDRVGPGREPVAIVVGQGIGYAAAVLGTLKSGRPYAPLDPSDPIPRVRGFADACDARVVLTNTASRDVAVALAVPGGWIDVDEIQQRATPPEVALDPDAVAYVFLTSGSTGAPKGVYDSHRNVLHNVLRYTNALEIAPADRLTLLQGPAFSGCVSSQFGALLNGAASYPFRLGEEGLVRAADWLRGERITIYHSVPAIFRAIVACGVEFPDVRVVRLEGDRASWEDVSLWKRHFGSGCILANGLGTTETGLASQFVVRHGDAPKRGVLPVGHAARDMTVVVVDDDRVPVPDGEIGEIAVASDYLALGYWNRPDLTAQRFPAREGARLYLTGDLGRLADDGCLEHLGRKEGDLKVLGVRVEPAEIERELLRVDGVCDAAVAVRAGPRHDGRVVAYVVPGDEKPDLTSIRAALSERVPAALLPSALVELEALPLGPNGKIDRHALPDVAPGGGDGLAPTSPREGWLTNVWAEALGVDSVAANDDFFELGGDSLAAAQIIARIEVETGRTLPVSVFLGAPTVAQLTKVLASDDPTPVSALTLIKPGERDGTPLLLLHGNTGNVVHFGRLVEWLDGRRPLWSLEYLRSDVDLRVDAIAAAHQAVVERARPAGPYLLAGFCYGGVIAHELGRRLASDGHDVRVAILGITPVEFPTVVGPDAYARWRLVSGPRAPLFTRLRYHTRVAVRLGPREMPPYVAHRMRNVVARATRRMRGRHNQQQLAPAEQTMSTALSAHRPRPFPGRPLVVLHHDDMDIYTDAPQKDWAALGTDGVQVVVLPGGDHAMLEGRGVQGLAAVLDAWAASVTPEPL